MAGGKDAKFGPSEFAPGELTNGQSVVKDGIFAVARVTKGIAEGTVYMERFWNPEFLEDGSDGRKSWTTENMNVLTKNTGYFNPEFGTYTLRGIHVKVAKAQRPEEGILVRADRLRTLDAGPTENTGGAFLHRNEPQLLSC